MHQKHPFKIEIMVRVLHEVPQNYRLWLLPLVDLETEDKSLLLKSHPLQTDDLDESHWN